MVNEKLVSKIFDSVVKNYDRFLNSMTFGKIGKWQRELAETVSISVNGTVLDVGTGTGEVLKKFKEINLKNTVIGLDVSQNMLKKAKEKTGYNTFIKASAYNLPFKNCSLDAIVSSLVFRHLDNEKALLEFNRVLKEDGLIGILDIAKPNPLLYRIIYFLGNKIFRPIGQLIFSREEWDYFMHSIENSKTERELEKLFEKHSYKKIYSSKKFGGLVIIIVFKKK